MNAIELAEFRVKAAELEYSEDMRRLQDQKARVDNSYALLKQRRDELRDAMKAELAVLRS